tara:strand:- start:50 stop:511 length:462 start_codon:yes stop_codon:yes gene_type:complete
MFQQQNIMDPGFMRMLQIRDAMRRGQPAMMEGRTDMGTSLEALPGDESFGQLGEPRAFEATDEMKAQLGPGLIEAGATTQLEQVQQAVNEMQQNQQALADHLGAGSRMANNQRQVRAGLAGLFQPQPYQPQPSRFDNVRLQQTLGPESLMRSI